MDRSVWLEVLRKRESHELQNLSEGDRHSVRAESLSRRLGVVVLTPSSNLDDQVAVENSAASQSLGWSYGINCVISHAQFRTQARTWRTGQPTYMYIYRERETEREVEGDGHRLGLCVNRTNMDEQEHYVHLIKTVSVHLVHSKASCEPSVDINSLQRAKCQTIDVIVTLENNAFKWRQTTNLFWREEKKNTMNVSARRYQKWNEAGLNGMRQERSLTYWCGVGWDRGWHGTFKQQCSICSAELHGDTFLLVSRLFWLL